MNPNEIDRLNAALSGHYRIERELGEGGMATVYLAHDVKHDRKVALKVLKPELSAAVGAERFLREIKIAAQLNHPHIVGLIDSGEADGLLYFVMFYVEGESLRDRLAREKQLPIAEALRITRQLGDALGYAHERGVIHRDIKPDNVLLEGEHARLADFGIAKALTDVGSDHLTRTGHSMGTPRYMSPEQAAGDVEPDARTDVYSLASVLYEMLAGGSPFEAATPTAMLARKMMEKPPGLRVVRSSVPPAVESAIFRALDPTPADRQPSVEAFLAELTAESGGAGGAEREVAVTRSGRWRRALPFAALLGAVGVVALAVRVALDRGPSPPLVASFMQLTSEPGVEDAPCLSPDGQWVIYAADADGDRDIFLRSIGGQNPILLTAGSSDDDTEPVFSPDGSQIAFRSSRSGGGIFVMGRTGDGVRRVADDGYAPDWSPDGTRLVYTMEDVGITPLNMELTSDLWVVPVDGGDPTPLGVSDGVGPSWSPRGHRIAYGTRFQPESELGAQLDIMTIAAEGGDPVHVTRDEANDWSPAWSADGRHLYFVSDRGGSMNLWRVPIDEESGRTSGELEAVTAPAQFVAHPCVSADGRHIVYTSLVTTTQNVQKLPFDPTTGTVGEPVWVTSGTRRWANPDPNADGSLLTMYSQDRPEGDLYIVGGDGSGLRQITFDEAIDRVPRWSADASQIAYFSTRGGALDVWMIRPDGSDNRQITLLGAGVATWSPDGARIVAKGQGVNRVGGVRPWIDGAVDSLPTYSDESGDYAPNDWSPDGLYLAGSMDYRDTGVVVYSIADRAYERLTDFGHWPVFLPDSRRILFVSGGKTFHVVDMRTGEIDWVYATPWDVLGPPRLTEDAHLMFLTRRVTEGDVWLATID